jgi:hypothetical protein
VKYRTIIIENMYLSLGPAFGWSIHGWINQGANEGK